MRRREATKRVQYTADQSVLRVQGGDEACAVHCGPTANAVASASRAHGKKEKGGGGDGGGKPAQMLQVTGRASATM